MLSDRQIFKCLDDISEDNALNPAALRLYLMQNIGLPPVRSAELVRRWMSKGNTETHYHHPRNKHFVGGPL